MHYIGIDIGGTTIKASRVDATGKVLESAKAPTPANDLPELIAAIRELVTRLGTQVKVDAIGVGIPGLVNARREFSENPAGVGFHYFFNGNLFILSLKMGVRREIILTIP